ncbi:MAG: DUF3024 domain-containing protein [Planctomycetota bacterium]
MFSELEILALRAVLDDFCEARVPPAVRDRLALQYSIENHTVTLFERRPHLLDKGRWMEIDVARFRYSRARNLWTLFYRDQNGKWHVYDRVEPIARFQDLLDEVGRDPTTIFWG